MDVIYDADKDKKVPVNLKEDILNICTQHITCTYPVSKRFETSLSAHVKGPKENAVAA